MFFIGSDHAGFELKEKLKNYFRNIDWQDLGTHSDERVDYPDFASKVCERVLEDKSHMGLLICGSGQGMAIRANRYRGIRAALCWNEESAKLSRAHNNANVLCLGARLCSQEQAIEIIKSFIKTSYEAGRHEDRVQKIDSPSN